MSKVKSCQFVDVSNKGDHVMKKVLIADDTALFREMIKNALSSEEYHIVGEAVTGDEAVDMYKEKNTRTLDGESWDLPIVYSDGRKRISSGMNEYPNNLRAFSIFPFGYPDEDIEQQNRFDESRIHYVE